MTKPVFRTNHPFGPINSVSVTSGVTMPATIVAQETVLTITEMAAAGTLNLTQAQDVAIGAKLTILVSADGTGRALTFGTGITGNNVTITANKTWIIQAVKTGANFVVTSALATN